MNKPFIFCTLLNSESTSLKQRLLKGAFWSLLGALIGKGFVLASFILVARIIGKHAYGELGIIRSTINLFTVVTGMGIGYTASKFIAQYRNSDIKKAVEIYTLSNTMSLLIGFIGSIVLILSAQYIAENSLNASHLTLDIQIGAIVLFFTTINGIQSGALSGFESFKQIAINTFISSLIQSLLLIILSYYYGISGCIVSLGIGCMCLGILNYRSINTELKKNNIVCKLSHIKKETFSILWNFSFPALLSSIMVVPVLWWAKTFLVTNAGYNEMAIFDVADQWAVMVLFIPGTLAQIILPLLSNTLAEGTKTQYIKLIKINLLINFAISFSVSLLVVLCGRFILSLYGKDFVQPYPLYLMMVSSILMSVCNVVGQVIASRDKMWIGFAFNFAWAIWIVIFTNLFKNLGASGLALAIAISYALHFMAQVVYLKDIFKKITI
jgi:O-antigen/teichoic acid export membrane protein